MNKLTAKLQKIDGYISVVVYALMFVYALGMATPAAPCKYYQDVLNFYTPIMPYNNAILLLSIFGLLVSAFYFLLRNHVRTVYYVSNFSWYGLNFVYTIASAVVTFIGVSYFQGQYQKLPFDTMNTYFDERGLNQHINANTSVFILGYVLGALLLLSLVPYVLVLIDKIQLRIRYEKNKKNGIANPVTYDPKEAK